MENRQNSRANPEIESQIKSLLDAKDYDAAFKLAKDYYQYDQDKTYQFGFVLASMARTQYLKIFIDTITPLANNPGKHQAEAAYVIGWYYAVYNPKQHEITKRYLKLSLSSQYENSTQRLVKAFQSYRSFNQTLTDLQSLLKEFADQPCILSKIHYAIGILYNDNRSKNKNYEKLAIEALERAIEFDSDNTAAFKTWNELITKPGRKLN